MGTGLPVFRSILARRPNARCAGKRCPRRSRPHRRHLARCDVTIERSERQYARLACRSDHCRPWRHLARFSRIIARSPRFRLRIRRFSPRHARATPTTRMRPSRSATTFIVRFFRPTWSRSASSKAVGVRRRTGAIVAPRPSWKRPERSRYRPSATTRGPSQILRSYETLQFATTVFEISIVLVSISALAGTRLFLPFGCGVSVIGLALFIVGLLQAH